MEAFLSETDRGVTMLAIVGAPGIGKTALWEDAVRQARARGARVLVARPTESEARLSFAGLTDLVADVDPEVFAALPPPQHLALEVALLRAAADRPPEPRTVATALLSLAPGAVRRAPVVVAVDDVAVARPAVAPRAVEFAMRRLAGEPVRLVVSVRREAERTGLVGRVPDADCSASSSGRFRSHHFTASSSISSGRRFRGRRSSGSRGPRAATRSTRSRSPGCSTAGGPGADCFPFPTICGARRRPCLAPSREDPGARCSGWQRWHVLTCGCRRRCARARRGGGSRPRSTPSSVSISFIRSSPRPSTPRRRSLAGARRTARSRRSSLTPEERARHLALAADGPDEAVARAASAAAARGRDARRARTRPPSWPSSRCRLTPDGDTSDRRLRLELADHLYLRRAISNVRPRCSNSSGPSSRPGISGHARC